MVYISAVTFPSCKMLTRTNKIFCLVSSYVKRKVLLKIESGTAYVAPINKQRQQ